MTVAANDLFLSAAESDRSCRAQVGQNDRHTERRSAEQAHDHEAAHYNHLR